MSVVLLAVLVCGCAGRQPFEPIPAAASSESGPSGTTEARTDRDRSVVPPPGQTSEELVQAAIGRVHVAFRAHRSAGWEVIRIAPAERGPELLIEVWRHDPALTERAVAASVRGIADRAAAPVRVSTITFGVPSPPL